VKLLFVSRLAVRKGVEQVVELSRRLADMEGRVAIDVIGDASLFSDYRHLLEDANPAICTYLGVRTGEQVMEHLRASHALVQPSWYEPFALTVGEALATGLPVLVTTAVGAQEGVAADVCRRFDAGDIDALERETRRLVDELAVPGRAAELATLARDEARRLFASDVCARQIASALEALL
jgi:glycosyltransferase involved in cell wall biosynthesis